MLSLCPIFALDRYKKGLSINSISDIPRRYYGFFVIVIPKLNTQKEEYSEVFQRDDARMILEKRKGGGNRVLFSFSLSRTPKNTNTNKGKWKVTIF